MTGTKMTLSKTAQDLLHYACNAGAMGICAAASDVCVAIDQLPDSGAADHRQELEIVVLSTLTTTALGAYIVSQYKPEEEAAAVERVMKTLQEAIGRIRTQRIIGETKGNA